MSFLDWGKFVGILAERFIPSKKEALRNEINKTQREMDEILKQHDNQIGDSKRYASLAIRLRELEERLKNI